jgi:hypothetical protein
MTTIVSGAGRLVMGGLRKVRNAWRIVTGADLEDKPHDPNDPPGGNASGNIGGIGGGANW